MTASRYNFAWHEGDSEMTGGRGIPLGGGVMRSFATVAALVLMISPPLVDIGSASDGPPSKVSSGTTSKPLTRKPPLYPRNYARLGREGMVTLSYVVGVDGSVRDVFVQDSSGEPEFEKAAINAMKRWTYEPATLDGEPVEQCHNAVRMYFTFEDTNGARSSFRRKFGEATQLLIAGEVEKAAPRVAELVSFKGPNLFERTHAWMLEGWLARLRGEDDAALEKLDLAMTGDFLSGVYYEQALRWRFAMTAERLRLQSALAAYDELMGLEENILPTADVTKMAEQIRALQASDKRIVLEGKVDDARAANGALGLWSHKLFRRRFGFDELEGSYDHVDIRCDYRRAQSPISGDEIWEIPESWGECTILVFGEPGATFKLVEFGVGEAREASPEPPATGLP